MKRFFRFSLFALMAVVTVAAVLLSYVGYYRVRSSRFDTIRNELQANGGAFSLTSEADDAPAQAESSWTESVFGPNAFAELDEVTLFLNQPAPGLVSRVLDFDSPVCINAYGKGIGDEDAAAIGSSAIEELDLDSTSLTPEGYASIAKASYLKHLTLVSQETATANLAPLAKCRSLSELTLIDAEMTPELVAAVAEIKTLRELFLFQVRWPSEAGWQAMNQLTQLETLRITSSKTPPGTSPALGDLSNLRRIEIDAGELKSFDGVRVSPEFVEALATVDSLQTLEVGLMKVEPPLAVWPSMSELPGLTRLSLAKVRGVEDFSTVTTATSLTSLDIGEGFQNSSLTNFAELKRLTQLTIDSDQVTDEAVAYLQGLPKLTELNAGGAGFTDNAIDELAKIKTLRKLTLGPQVTKEAAERLKEALPKCQITLVNSTGNEIGRF
ncbi:leucine-rich repeat domain-containing protein [Blastopirellula marina]|uniref:Disease resistance R13L4/SHOC-2-like LRR domain-containing protein n=1 Tax=Blastopirellula marina TaxID=124 RepID=A0A2S8GFL5_9BACT|nr:leucine-rich repeat domain-containing protein [Blastopirellula marina]PQO43257.1 hypothetical protein C5Y93_26525 [Blastopirellula marina]